MRLGKFISLLSAAPKDSVVRFRRVSPADEEYVSCSVPDDASPGTFMSYRGYYDRLALDWTPTENAPLNRTDRTVGELLSAARECVDKTFCGYKGGEYTMDEFTLVHLACYGETSNDVPVGVEIQDGIVAVLVAAVESW